MRLIIGHLMGLLLVVGASAETLIEGRVRLASGQPVGGAQVRLFAPTDLSRSVRATTDENGYFALPLAALSTTALPEQFYLGQNYPNPFNPSTIIPYQLPVSTRVRLEVFNVLGQRLATLVDAEQPAGFSHGDLEWYGCGRAWSRGRIVSLPASWRWDAFNSVDGVTRRGGWEHL